MDPSLTALASVSPLAKQEEPFPRFECAEAQRPSRKSRAPSPAGSGRPQSCRLQPERFLPPSPLRADLQSIRAPNAGPAVRRQSREAPRVLKRNQVPVNEPTVQTLRSTAGQATQVAVPESQRSPLPADQTPAHKRRQVPPRVGVWVGVFLPLSRASSSHTPQQQLSPPSLLRLVFLATTYNPSQLVTKMCHHVR